MKSTTILILILSCVLLSSVAQNSEVKEALAYTESINFNMQPIELYPDENICYLTKRSDLDIIELDGNKFSSSAYIFLESGSHTLTIQQISYHTTKTQVVSKGVVIETTTTSEIRSLPINIAFEFEDGKYYFLGQDLDITKIFSKTSDVINTFIEEITDLGKLEKTKGKFDELRAKRKEEVDNYHLNEQQKKDFLAFHASHPNHLDGTWKGEKKRLMNKFAMQYTFSGDTLKYEGKSKTLKNRPFKAEGNMIYNENTIVFFPQKGFDKEREVKSFSDEPPFIWYYKIDGDIMQIEGGRLFGKAFIWENTGTFHKEKSDL